MASFRFCETYLLQIKALVVNKSSIIPFLVYMVGPTSFDLQPYPELGKTYNGSRP